MKPMAEEKGAIQTFPGKSSRRKKRKDASHTAFHQPKPQIAKMEKKGFVLHRALYNRKQ